MIALISPIRFILNQTHYHVFLNCRHPSWWPLLGRVLEKKKKKNLCETLIQIVTSPFHFYLMESTLSLLHIYYYSQFYRLAPSNLFFILLARDIHGTDLYGAWAWRPESRSRRRKTRFSSTHLIKYKLC